MEHGRWYDDDYGACVKKEFLSHRSEMCGVEGVGHG